MSLHKTELLLFLPLYLPRNAERKLYKVYNVDNSRRAIFVFFFLFVFIHNNLFIALRHTDLICKWQSVFKCVYLNRGIRHPHGPVQVVHELWQRSLMPYPQ